MTFLKYIFVILSYLLIIAKTNAQTNYVFHQLSVKDGLSEGSVRAIIEDNRGYMWFGTEDGLNKYDGYRFTVFKTSVSNNYSISSNNVKCFFNDSKGNLWIGTRHGINLYNPELNRFYNYKSDDYLALQSLQGDIEEIIEDNKNGYWVLTTFHGLFHVTDLHTKPQQFKYSKDYKVNLFASMTMDTDGNLWIGSNDGLLKFNTKENNFTDLRERYGKGFQVRTIHLDKKQNLWLATTDGLKYVDVHSGEVKAYKHGLDFVKSPCGNNTHHILTGKSPETLIISIDGSGIDFLDTQTLNFTHYTKESGSQLNCNNITSIYIDSKGTFWAGSFLNGINFTNINTNFFVMVKNNSPSVSSLKTGVITNFLKNSNGDFWISTDGGGLYEKKKNAKEFLNYKAGSSNSIIGSNAVISLMEDSQKNLWIATYAGGLTRLDKNRKSTIFKYNPDDSVSLVFNKVKSVAEYNDKIWVSSFGMGICYYNKKTNNFKRYHHKAGDKQSIPSDWVYWFYVDSKNILWLCTFQGLAKYIPETDNFITYRFDTDGHTEDLNYIFDICEDSDHNFWIGTNGGGLILFDRDKEKFNFFTTNNALSNNTVRSIIEDNNKNLWLATNNGVTKFSITNKIATAYTMDDGLPPCSFFCNARYKDENGKIYFGTNEGYLVIDPFLATEKIEFPKVVLTELKIFDTIISTENSKKIIDKDISVASKIQLDYIANSISIEFAGLNFSFPKHNYYKYKLEGFENEWHLSGKSRIAKYTNLDPGDYIFLVKATNNENVWGETSKTFKISITPPFWRTWWFKTICGILIFGTCLTFYKIRIKTIEYQKKSLEQQVDLRTSELEKAKNEISVQRDNLKVANDHVISSINFANTIQRAILTSTEKIETAVSDYFVIYKPKDIVSGDFYWFSKLPTFDEKHMGQGITYSGPDVRFVATVDCTGHGVSGAFMSIIGNTLLNEIINQKFIFDPATILSYMDIGLKRVIPPSDGFTLACMDVCLCRLEDIENNKVRIFYSGAKRPLYYVEFGSNEVIKLSADVVSIGSDFCEENTFTVHELILEKGSVLYLTSDGFADQNNFNNKKISTEGLKQLIKQTCTFPLKKQKVMFEKALSDHQGTMSQRDDITIVAVRV